MEFELIALVVIDTDCTSNCKSSYNKPIDGVMVSVLASSAVDRKFEPRSGQTKL